MATKAIPVVAAKVAATLADYPAYVKPSAMTGWGSLTLAQVESMRWYSDSGLTTELASDPVSSDEIHVKVTSLTSSTTIYVDYDGVRSKYAVGATYGRNAVWSNYAMVLHAGGDTDSAGNITLTANGGVVSGGATGNIGSATSFDGSDDFFEMSSKGGIGASGWTFQTWLNATVASSQGCMVGLYDGSGAGGDIFLFKKNTSTSFQLRSGHLSTNEFDVRPTGSLTEGTWAMQHASYDNAKARWYSDGSLESTTSKIGSADPFDDATIMRVGARTDNAQYFQGLLSELRIADLVLSDDWITTEYNNQDDVGTFWGTVTDAGGGVTANNSARRQHLMMM